MKDENAHPASDVHAGHRERLKKRAQEVGLTALPPHEVIELLLFYAVPRQDVNELAHALIDRFETVTGVLSAGEEELMKVPGVGFRVAGTLAAFFRAANAYRLMPAQARTVIRARGQAASYAKALFEGDMRPQTWLVLSNAGGEVLFTSRMLTGAMWLNDQSRLFIAERALRYDAHYVVLLARRGFRTNGVSHVDRKMISELSDYLDSIGVYVMDYLVVCPDRVVSLKNLIDAPPPRPRRTSDFPQINETWQADPDEVWEAEEIPDAAEPAPSSPQGASEEAREAGEISDRTEPEL